MTTPLQPASPAIRVYPDGRMDVANAAAYLGVSPKSLAVMRCTGKGPTFTKLGKLVFYRQDDLDDWITSRRAVSTADYRRARNAAPMAAAA